MILSRKSPPLQSTPDASSLQSENEQLRASLQSLLDQAHDNQLILQRHHHLNLKLIGADSLTELLQLIFQDLKESSSLDVVTLLLTEDAFDIRRIMTDLKIQARAFPWLLLSNLSESDFSHAKWRAPRLERFNAEEHQILFPDHQPTPASVAILPLLRHKRLVGYLGFGSADPERFIQGVATDFIEEQATIIAICLENVINNERLKYLSLTDPLTRVSNRRHFELRLREEVVRSQRQSYPLACLYIDIDHFKRINDLLGHQEGDAVLCGVATRIKSELRLSDSIARFGGEEFVVLLINTHTAGAKHVAERIRARIMGQPFQVRNERSCKVTVSIGAAEMKAGPENQTAESIAKDLLARADEALYRAKNSGRNRVLCAN